MSLLTTSRQFGVDLQANCLISQLFCLTGMTGTVDCRIVRSSVSGSSFVSAGSEYLC